MRTLETTWSRLAVALCAALASPLALAQEYGTPREPAPGAPAAPGDGGGAWIWIVVALAVVLVAWGIWAARRGRRAGSGGPTPRGP